ncbi:MAG: flagellar hook-basal body complex protein, partial [Planctomycetota bacterium]|nr:flagellar hook-basal body complex protein [Planctomycetota bacterium]
SGTTWEYIAESSDNDALSRIVGLGTVNFDGNGNYVNTSNSAFSMTRTNGAVSPLIVQMEFSTPTDQISAFTAADSSLAMTFQDGSPLGTLASFTITGTGLIEGSFTNGLTRTVGQIAMAKFLNPEGLIDAGGGDFLEGPNSGSAIVTEALQFGTGRMIGGALELSNVDLSMEFINMIMASTGYSASSRVISTTDELIDQLLLIGR